MVYQSLSSFTLSFPRRRESRSKSVADSLFYWIPTFAGMTRYVLYLMTLLLLASPAKSDEAWDNLRFSGLKTGVEYAIASGTGFYVNSENIVTNRHVVSKCLNIAIRGATLPQKAEIVVIDQGLDLALLRVAAPSARVPYLRINYDDVKASDILFTVGYPLGHGKTGDYVIREAKVLSVSERTDGTNFTNIKFTDTVDHGNSGGPLLDKNSNIVGVVTAKITTYDPDDPANTRQTVGMAIGLDGLIDFLKRNDVTYASNATYDIFTNYNIDKLVKDYVVNIHCVEGEMSASRDATTEE
jgi:serine protease Do